MSAMMEGIIAKGTATGMKIANPATQVRGLSEVGCHCEGLLQNSQKVFSRYGKKESISLKGILVPFKFVNFQRQPHAFRKEDGFYGARATAESEKEGASSPAADFSKLASGAAAAIKEAAEKTGKVLEGVNAEKVMEAAAELKEKARELQKAAENLKARAEGETGKWADQAEKAKEQLREQSDSTASQLLDRAERTSIQLWEQAEKAAEQLAATAEASAELAKEGLASVAGGLPEPVKKIAETAISAHSKEAQGRGAKIHDFCLGIAFGTVLVVGGFFWFAVAGSINALRSGVALGGLLLTFAVASLNQWKAGKPTAPYTLVQAGVALLLSVIESFRYLQTFAIFPTLLAAMASIGMVGFYLRILREQNYFPFDGAINSNPTSSPTSS